MADDPTFDTSVRPERRFTQETVQYDGTVDFTLTPARSVETSRLEALVADVLNTGPYRYGDWFDLPMAVFLVHDDETHDTFRVSIRDGTITLHLLPSTDTAGLKALYERIVTASDCSWSVSRRIELDR